MTKILQWMLAYAMSALYWLGLPGMATRLYRLSGLPLFQGGADYTESQIGAGVTISFWNTALSPDAWDPLGEVRSIEGIGVTNPEVESTTLDSVAVERIAGLPDGKQVTLTFTTNSTNKGNVEGWVGGDPVDFRVVYPSPMVSGDSDYFTLVPLDYDLGTIEPSGLMEVTFMGRITGAIAHTDTHP